jgi:TPR repeat protein
MTLAAMAVWLTVTPAGCKQTASSAGPAHVDEGCVAESIGTLRVLPTISPCKWGDWICRARCTAGNGASCLALAYAADKDPETAGEAMPLYRRSCLLGEANACTNYAASVWAGEHSDDQLACARRTFEKACSAKEPFACGMVGRVMLESTTPAPVEEARKYLEALATRLAGSPAESWPNTFESGKLGGYPPGRIRSLLTKACAGGDPDACGEPATAAATFH